MGNVSNTSANVTAHLPLYPATFPGYVKKGTNDPLVNNRLAISRIHAKYSGIIDEACKVCNVPKELVLAVMFTENSPANPNTTSSAGAVGLMMLKAGTASDILIHESTKGRLLQSELAILKATIGDSAVKKLVAARSPGVAIVSSAMLKNPRLNVLIGTMFLGQLIDEHSEGGILRLDKVFARYNQGYYFKPGNGDPSVVLANAKMRSGEVYNYLLKTLGTNGIMQSLMG